MTGMPCDRRRPDGRLDRRPSWARMIRTFAPCEIRCSTLVACVSADDLASLPMYVPPPASMAALIAGSSHLAQRSSLKLFQDTPTLQPAALAPLAAGARCGGAAAARRARPDDDRGDGCAMRQPANVHALVCPPPVTIDIVDSTESAASGA